MDDRLFPLAPEKRCCTCKQVKPLTELNVMRKSPDGRQASCRECNRRYHSLHWDRHMSQIRRRRRERIARNREVVRRYLETHPCVDCGETDIVVLEFDHLRDVGNISALVRSSETKRVVEEIEKCAVVCANCHRRRTAQRGGWWKLAK